MRSEQLYLADILDAIEAIERFTSGIDESCFLADELIQSAVLQKLSLIGEAAARLSDLTREQVTDIPWKEIIGFAILLYMLIFRLIGAFFVTATGDLPSLKENIIALRDRGA